MDGTSHGSRKPSQQPEREPSPIPVISDIPLVVSDIPHVDTNNLNGAIAPPPQTQALPSKLKEKRVHKSAKRKASPKEVRSYENNSMVYMYLYLLGRHTANLHSPFCIVHCEKDQGSKARLSMYILRSPNGQ